MKKIIDILLGENEKGTSEEQNPEKKTQWYSIAVAAFGLYVLIVLIAYIVPSQTNHFDDIGAVTACQFKAMEYMHNPKSVDWKRWTIIDQLPNSAIIYQSFYAQTGFGAQVQNAYTCVATFRNNGYWDVALEFE